MSDKQTAAASLRRMAVQYQGILEAADALEALGSIENATKEAVSAREAAEKARDVAKETLASFIAQADKIKEECTTLVVTANADAASILNKAKQEAGAVIADAVEKSSAAANERTAVILAGAERKAKEAAAEYERVTFLLTEAQDTLKKLDPEIAEKQANLDKITKSFEALKAKLG